MSKQERHDYLIYLIGHLERSDDNTALDNFFVVAKDILKVRHTLSRVLDYPITLDQYEELITYAENLLGVNRFGSSDDLHYEHLLGRTKGATSAHGAQSIDEKLNNMMVYNDQIITDALVDLALEEVDEDLVKYSLEYHTPDQLTFDLLDADNNINAATKKAIKEALLKKREEYDDWFPNEETYAALEEAMNEDPKNFKTWDQVRKEIEGDKTDPKYQHYWGNGRDAHFFYASDFIDAWKCADLWHRELYYWPYNGQYIVGQVNPIEWYKTKGDEENWGPIFGPFDNPEELDQWVIEFWKWWHGLDAAEKEILNQIPHKDNEWHRWNINYEDMLSYYAAKEHDYYKIAADAQNDAYSKMSEQELDNYYKRLSYWEEAAWGYNEAFSDDWKDDVCNLVGEIKEVESRMRPDNDNNVFDSETLHYLEQKLLDLLKRTL